jgi:hypothetical protein
VGVAIRIPEVGDLGATLERGNTLLVSDDRFFVVAFEGDVLRGELLDDPLHVVDDSAGQGRR